MSTEPLDTDRDTADKLKSLELVQRPEGSGPGRFIYWAGVLFSLAHIYFNTLGTWSELYVSAIHFGGFALICALMVPGIKGARAATSKAVLVFDILVGLAAIACALYLIGYEDALYDRGVNFVASDWFFSALAILLALEMARRTTGWFIPCLIVVAMTYVFWWGPYIEGMFGFAGLSLETLLYRSYFGSDGMFGSIARISWTFVFMFILFGAFLVRSGAGDFIIELSRCAAGRFVGGPGFVAVLGSGLMGSVSGSSVANTVSTGVITIPLMRRAGFPARFAAGVEAAASTGGQLMPPVMGAGAFIMASYTQIPYVEIIAFSALPALMYFLSVGFYVRVEAMRSHAHAVELETRPLKEVLKEGWHFLLPLVVLVALLIYGFTPTYAAGVSIIAVVVASWLSKNPMGPRAVCDALAQGARNMATTAMLLVAVGLVVNVVAMTGIGNTFSLMVSDWAGGSLLITILLVGLASLVLGMGLPVTAAYIVLATLSAPAIYNLIAETRLVELMMSGGLPEAARMIFMLVDPEKVTALASPMSEAEARALLAQVPQDFTGQLMSQALDPTLLSMALLSAHMIIFWLSQDSNVTPPVCLTAFAAAAIAKTPPMATGFTAWKIAKGLYVVPLLLGYTNLIGGSTEEVLRVFIFGVFGLYAFVGFMEGFLEGRLNPLLRLLSGIAALAMLWPHHNLLIDLAGLALFVVLFLYSRRIAKAAPAA
ncbi:C4-dicarboxylate ABC transporter permease [Marinobacterium nitratireducens]|uniref:C4-dicarboxylate ABC transporter permease n=1 Tax=Marinobacterium nitratireducens TaxID=518897 RepID=A0A917Z7W0_9GAMM|nr:TRAP transporter fused permease subunit [Marinobacterium nitratireducens]GGO76869.1 C4-dicarboxylate ABC transporter permease [Marinobacterium nitratireducens]